MKINIQKWTRAIPCFLAVVFVLLVSVAPASAATFTGDWTFDKNISMPTWDSVSITFVSNGVTYSQMVYESFSEAYEVPLITFKSDTASRPAIYWRDGNTFFTDAEFQYVTFSGFQSDMSDVFSNWMFANAQQGHITADSSAAEDAENNVDNALGNLDGVTDELDRVPQPDIDADSYVPGEMQGQAYLNFVDALKVFWDNSLLTTFAGSLSGMILLSYVLFAGKA